jgi:hypothetical protein
VVNGENAYDASSFYVRCSPTRAAENCQKGHFLQRSFTSIRRTVRFVFRDINKKEPKKNSARAEKILQLAFDDDKALGLCMFLL